MEVKSTDGCTQTVLCALIECLPSMRSMLEPKKTGKTQRLSAVKSNILSTSLPQLHRLLWRRRPFAPRVGRQQCGGQAAVSIWGGSGGTMWDTVT